MNIIKFIKEIRNDFKIINEVFSNYRCCGNCLYAIYNEKFLVDRCNKYDKITNGSSSCKKWKDDRVDASAAVKQFDRKEM